MRVMHRREVDESADRLLVLSAESDHAPSREFWGQTRTQRQRQSLARSVAAAGAVLLGVCGAALLAGAAGSFSRTSAFRAAFDSELRAAHAMSAVEIPEGHHIVSVSKDLCLTRDNDDKGSLITSTICDVNDHHQKWVYKSDTDHIKTPSGKCLDDGGDFVHIWECRDDDDDIRENQRWIFSSDKYIKNGKGLCLHASINNGKVGFISCSNTEDMHWRLSLNPVELTPEPSLMPQAPETTPIPTQVPVQGQIVIQQDEFCLDGGGEAVHLWYCAQPTADQVWEQDPNTMQLRNGDGRCLDVSSHTLQMACDSDSKMQKWNVDQQTGHVYSTAAGYHCLASARPLNHGDIVGLKECAYGGKPLVWIASQADQAHLDKFKEIYPDPHLDMLVVIAIPVLALIIISLFILLNMRRKKAQPTIVQPKSEPEEDPMPEPSDPNVNAVKITDPRPSTNRHLQVGVLAFGFDGKEPWDELCNAPWLSNGFDMGPGGIQVEAYGVSKGFNNAEAAFHALKFWPVAAEFANLSAEQALGKKSSLSGREDFDNGGYGSKWRGMQAVLNAKFKTGSRLDKMLGKTGDAFLLYHTSQKGFDQLWSDDSDGDGTNWVGMQLMLLREKRSGWKRWTTFIESCVSTTTGEVNSENSAWQDTVRNARKALQEVLADQRSQQQFEQLRQEREARQAEEEQVENNGSGEQEGG